MKKILKERCFMQIKQSENIFIWVFKGIYKRIFIFRMGLFADEKKG